MYLLLALLGAHHILHVSRIRVKTLSLKPKERGFLSLEKSQTNKELKNCPTEL
jgi:hypothetical protein